jgi:hypothetical protein
MKCPKCQFDVKEGARFCEQCGIYLARKCPDCGAEVSQTARFRAECGYNITTSSPTPAPPVELSFEEKLENIQRYLPGGLTEKILARRGKIEGERTQAEEEIQRKTAIGSPVICQSQTYLTVLAYASAD